MSSKHLEVGKLGEEIASKFLKSKSYSLVDRNYRRKWGEIDIIAKIGEIYCFVEVKTVSRERSKNVSEEYSFDNYRPEDNIHPWKIKRLSRVIQTYISREMGSVEVEWRFDVITVLLDRMNRKARVFHLKDIVL